MSEQTSTAVAGEQNEQSQEQGKEFEAITSQEDFDARIQARIARERAKVPTDYDELKAAAAELAQIREANRTEEEKRDEAFKTTAKERDEARRDAALARAALKHGLSEDDLELISEGPAEGIEARAEKLAARLGEKQSSGPSSSAIGRTNASTGTPDLDAAIRAAEESRDIPLAITLKRQKAAQEKG